MSRTKTNSGGGYVYWRNYVGNYCNKYEHRLIAERVLGKPLPPEAEVHHVDFDGLNNNNNLVICENRLYHRLLHVRTLAYRATGDPNSRQCRYCRQWDEPKNLYMRQEIKSPSGVGIARHRSCHARYERERKRRNS